ncbi:MAG: DUF3108 domain-containing protein [Flavipsychrobacter sp.]|nr:DUF3108 domain-containing protein [Flavipsychrobacter sp.]
MRFIKRIGLIILVFLAQGVSAQDEFCGGRNTSFVKGEKVFYKVYYNVSLLWVNAGEADFNVTQQMYNGRSTYHVVADGRTVKSYEWFFKVRDRYETYLDEQTMLPMKFLRNVNEGGTKILNDVTFYHDKGQAVSTNGVFTIPRCTQDILSAIYYARNIDYNKHKPGDKIPFNLFLDDKLYPLYIKYMGKEQVTTKYGTFNAVKLAPLLIEGTIFKGGDKMRIWVSDDANHIPLRVESPILIGSIKVDLMGYENLRSPFTSLVSKDE